MVTGTAVVMGTYPWQTAAGIIDLILAAAALARVLTGERDRRRVYVPDAHPASRIG